MPIEYLISFIASLGLLVAYLLMVKNKERWLTGLYCCVPIINLGYMMLSYAKTLTLAIIFNDLVYLGSVFIFVCMFHIIVKLCGFGTKKWVTITSIILAIVMFLIVATSGILPWYYKSVSLVEIDGATKMVKEYGTLHPLYLVYVVGYFIAMITAITIAIVKKKIGKPKFAIFLAGIVCGNIVVWIFEKFIKWDYEFLSVTYIMSELLMLLVYWMMQDYVNKRDIPKTTTAEEKTSIIIVDSMPRAEKIELILKNLPSGSALTQRQMEVLEGILDGKSRRQIAVDLHLSENTVKMHTTSLFRALGVSSREEVFALISGK